MEIEGPMGHCEEIKPTNRKIEKNKPSQRSKAHKTF